MKIATAICLVLIVVSGGSHAFASALDAQGANVPIKWQDVPKQRPAWYASDDAVRIADNVILYQRESGGWPKNLDMASVLSEQQRADILKEKPVADSTIDNGATYTQLNFLARVFRAKRMPRLQASFLKGFDYLLAAQYGNGGWPQYYPLKKGYYQHITFNDDAMIGVMRLLRDIALKKPDYTLVDEDRRARAENAVANGVECILKTQVVVRGKRTAWCAQHDEVTFAPASARTFEPISLSGLESAGIVRFLMDIQHPDARVVLAIESAVAWFKSAQLNGVRWIETPATSKQGYDHVLIADQNAPPLWARFYEIETNRPIFSGRDRLVKYDVAEIEDERRNGYRWYTDEPARLLNRDYPAWLRRLASAETATK